MADVAERSGARHGGPAPGPPGHGARLDRIPLFSLHRRLAVAVGLGTFFDLYDIFHVGVLAAMLATQRELSSDGTALVIASASSPARSSSAASPTATAAGACS